MPYANEHTARVKEPSDFKDDSFRRKNIKDGIDIIMGKLKSGGDSMVTQAYRFDASKFSVQEAKDWLKKEDVKYIKFETASGESRDALKKRLVNVARNLSTPRKWYNMQSPDDPGDIPTAIIYDAIGQSYQGEGLSPKDFQNDISELVAKGHKKLNLRINSPGGYIHDGFAIYNCLKRSGLEIDVYIDGLAASCASFIAMAGRKVYMPLHSEMMIHDPWSIIMGDAEDMRTEASHLDSLKEMIVDIYAQKTGLEDGAIKSMMNKQTWLNGEKCVALGFADELIEESKAAACMFELDSDMLPGLPEGFKKLQNAKRKRMQEKVLRDEGLSNSQAKAQANSRREGEASDEIDEGNEIVNAIKEGVGSWLAN
jgi:ATP-dependent Clp endopeptidase proteolytic subunit ClpP